MKHYFLRLLYCESCVNDQHELIVGCLSDHILEGQHNIFLDCSICISSVRSGLLLEHSSEQVALSFATNAGKVGL